MRFRLVYLPNPTLIYSLMFTLLLSLGLGLHAQIGRIIEQPLNARDIQSMKPSENLQWASAVAGFGMLLRDSKYKGKLDYTMLKTLANNAKGKDEEGYRADFIRIVKEAELLKK